MWFLPSVESGSTEIRGERVAGKSERGKGDRGKVIGDAREKLKGQRLSDSEILKL
jgi:hypothetical protein